MNGAHPPELSLASGTELLGEFESTAFARQQFLIRRADGQILQVGRLSYALAAAMDGRRDAAGIAAAVSADLGRQVRADDVTDLVRDKLAPLGILGPTGGDPGDEGPVDGSAPRTGVVPAALHRQATRLLAPLFRAPAVITLSAALIALDVWLAASAHGRLVGGAEQLVRHPALLLVVGALVILSGAFHELGHLTAARRGGAEPGVMGVGINALVPVFFSDVANAHRLDRRSRLRTDCGGVYFSAIAASAGGLVFLGTRWKPLLVYVVFTQLQILYQFLPFLRLDGYYLVSDLVGVPNLSAFVGPAADGLLHRTGRSRDRLIVLTRKAQFAISLWLIAAVPIAAAYVAAAVVLAPHVLPVLVGAIETFGRRAGHDLGAGAVPGAIGNGAQLVLLLMPLASAVVVAVALTARFGGRAARSAGWVATVLRPPKKKVWAAPVGLATVMAVLATVALVVSGAGGWSLHPTPSVAVPPARPAIPPARPAGAGADPTGAEAIGALAADVPQPQAPGDPARPGPPPPVVVLSVNSAAPSGGAAGTPLTATSPTSPATTTTTTTTTTPPPAATTSIPGRGPGVSVPTTVAPTTTTTTGPPPTTTTTRPPPTTTTTRPPPTTTTTRPPPTTTTQPPVSTTAAPTTTIPVLPGPIPLPLGL